MSRKISYSAPLTSRTPLEPKLSTVVTEDSSSRPGSGRLAGLECHCRSTGPPGTACGRSRTDGGGHMPILGRSLTTPSQGARSPSYPEGGPDPALHPRRCHA
ncbi:hypothetical protein ACFFX0_05725 [Citricoccus parietis]|uniref:Uncharacterized protein n=1 Tax=Citricoccus parietis TaxID=592307 RepID=A0ABV5FVJ8_9MICC